MGADKPAREWTVAVFVVDGDKVLMLRHRKLGKWLPPGGHVEPDELPDAAAVREVYEETGLQVELVGPRALPVTDPVQLVQPRGIQVENITPGHQHIDLVYLARPLPPVAPRPNRESTQLGWYNKAELAELPLTDEIRLWVELALREMGGKMSETL